MTTEFRKALIPKELRSLVVFDHKEFPRSDCFLRDGWRKYESWWMVVDGRKIGCCAFELHKSFQEDVREDGENADLRGSLYVASSGIIPSLRQRGFGTLLKSWQVSYALHHGFSRIIANTRKSNHAMIKLNKKFGFKIIRTTPKYYDDPCEATVVMEILL